MMEGFMAKFDELRGDIHALRERVEQLQMALTNLQVQAATSAKPVPQSTAQPPASTITAKSTTGAPTTAKSASK